MGRITLTIANKLGLHMRAANVLAEAASRHACTVRVCRGEMCVNGKSIMGLMMLAAPCGTQIDIETEGPGADEALAALTALVRAGFGEELADPPVDGSGGDA